MWKNNLCQKLLLFQEVGNYKYSHFTFISHWLVASYIPQKDRTAVFCHFKRAINYLVLMVVPGFLLRTKVLCKQSSLNSFLTLTLNVLIITPILFQGENNECRCLETIGNHTLWLNSNFPADGASMCLTTCI